MRYIFLAGLFDKSNYKYILDNSKNSVIQNAANSLQWGYLSGLDQLLEKENFSIINIPFIGSFPNRFRKIFFPSSLSKTPNGAEIKNICFINITIFKLFFRYISALYGLRKALSRKQKNCIIIYSAHTPFLLSAVTIKYFNSSVSLCLIIPDLPEHMGGSGLFYHQLKIIESWILLKLIKKVNFFVLLTEPMIDFLKIPKEKSIVIEGIHADLYTENQNSTIERNLERITIFYSGTLDERYGIKNLLDTFSEIKKENIELWICGEGNYKNNVIEASTKDHRVVYLGQLKHQEVLTLQRKATLLINPRLPDNEFTKFSFPSKIIEYMASGRPVIMHKLPGIPEEYYDHCFYPSNSTNQALLECLNSTLMLDDESLSKKGIRAKEFISQKTPYIQVAKLLNLIAKGTNI